MAVVQKRRSPHLKLHLPDSAADHLAPRLFPPPLPPQPTTHTQQLPPSAATSDQIERLSDLETISVLGHGSGGTVYKALHRRTAAVYALKLIHAPDDPPTRRQALREPEILRRAAGSARVVRCHASFPLPSGDLAVVLDYLPGGSLDGRLRRSGPFSEADLSRVAGQTLEGLAHLHARKIVHRDIKPANLLSDEAMSTIKITDFGVSKVLIRSLEACGSYVGTCAYMSPERFDPQTYGVNYDGFAGDVWSLGLTLLELYLGHFPLLPSGQRPDWATLMCAICFGDLPGLPDSASEDFRNFIGSCLQKDASKRATVSELLGHPFVARSAKIQKEAGRDGQSMSEGARRPGF